MAVSKLISRLCDIIEALTDEKMRAKSFSRTFRHHENGETPPLWVMQGLDCGHYFSKVPARTLVKSKLKIIKLDGHDHEVIIDESA